MTVSNARKKEAEQIFNRWKASLVDRPRDHGHLSENFDDLFFDLHRLQLPYEMAYDYLERAYGAHFPSNKTIKWQYKRSAWAKNHTEEEFAKQWRDYIKDKAVNVFHSYFEIPFTDGKSTQQVKAEKAKAKKASWIREYMENFTPVNLKALRAKRKEVEEMIKRESDEDLLENLESFDG